MSNNVIENVVKQNKIHWEIGYLEGLADAYRDTARKLESGLAPLEEELSDLVELLTPPF